MKKRFAISWRLEGVIEVEAVDAEAAQDKFDKMTALGIPRFIHDGEWSNEEPVETTK